MLRGNWSSRISIANTPCGFSVQPSRAGVRAWDMRSLNWSFIVWSRVASGRNQSWGFSRWRASNQKSRIRVMEGSMLVVEDWLRNKLVIEGEMGRRL